MDELKPYAVFAETVAAGSMSGAARRLGMSPSAVSQSIRALELQAGVTLLHRSTRKLTLTEAGERCYPHCRRLLESARAAAESLLLARDAPSGELRVAAPVGFAGHIASALSPLLTQSPDLLLNLLVDDAMIDLIDARIDIAIRVGRLADSSWVARPLGHFEMILCASAAYIERHGAPGAPQDLAKHHWLAFARESVEARNADSYTDLDSSAVQPPGERLPPMTFELNGPGGMRENVKVGVRIASNNQLSLQQMCEQGLGIARLGHVDVLPLLTRGALVRLLPQWRFAKMPVTAITPRRDGEPAKVRAAVDALKRYFGTLSDSVAV